MITIKNKSITFDIKNTTWYNIFCSLKILMCDNCDHGKEIMEKFKEDLLFALVVAGFVIFLLIVYLNSGRIIKEYKFNIECTQKIEQAANAASIEIADEKISEAISYLKKNNITSGNTSFIVRMPKNDVSYWYKNLLSIKEELESSYNSSSIEKGNLLLRLNNLLLDRDGKVIMPSNIAVYPNVALYQVAYYLGKVLIILIGLYIFRRIFKVRIW